MKRLVLAVLLSGCHEPNILVALDETLYCSPGTYTLEPATPSVMLVLDRSGSMSTALGSGTRWSTLAGALSRTLPQVDASLELGAYLFPAPGSQSNQCVVSGAPVLEPALSNAAALQQVLASTSPAGATPTAEAIDAAAEALAALAADGTARALVLATDGAPNCNAALNAATCTCAVAQCSTAAQCLDDARTSSRLAAQAAAGLPTWVVGIEDGTDAVMMQGALDRLAVAGGRPRTGGTHSYYSATSDAELVAALASIRDELRTCMFFTPSVPDSGGTVTVSLAGVALVEGTGWEWVLRASGELRLLGDACAQAIASTGAVVEVQVTCSADAGVEAIVE